MERGGQTNGAIAVTQTRKSGSAAERLSCAQRVRTCGAGWDRYRCVWRYSDHEFVFVRMERESPTRRSGLNRREREGGQRNWLWAEGKGAAPASAVARLELGGGVGTASGIHRK